MRKYQGLNQSTGFFIRSDFARREFIKNTEMMYYLHHKVTEEVSKGPVKMFGNGYDLL